MKITELREKTVEELQEAIVDWKKDLLNYKIQLATHKLENTALISGTKRNIAQAKTVIKEKVSGKEIPVKKEAPAAKTKTPAKKTTKAKVKNA